MSRIGMPRKGFSVIAYNDQKRARDAKRAVLKGNLASDYPADFLSLWPGCSHQDCLPQCRHGGPEQAYCERLEREWNDYQDAMERMDNGRNTGGKSYR